MEFDPFSESQLRILFETTTRQSDRLKRRESTWLEFKENFHLSENAKAMLGKTLAAFSNNGGGYIIFGVKNKPHLLVGMTNDTFIRLEPTRLTDFFNSHFSPSLEWQHFCHEIDGHPYGLIYVAEAKQKPVMCVCQVDQLRDGDVYFRYQGESRLIRSDDLQQIIQERLEAERKAWRELLTRTSKAEPTATYLLDVNNGHADGPKKSFVIDERLLERVKFIHQGRFAEGGDPTLRVLGNVDVVRTEIIPERIEEVPVDPSIFCTLWGCEVIDKLKQRLGSEVQFGDGTKKINGNFLRYVIQAHNIPTPSRLYFRPDKVGSRPQYGSELVEWIVDQYDADKQFFYKAKLATTI